MSRPPSGDSKRQNGASAWLTIAFVTGFVSDSAEMIERDGVGSQHGCRGLATTALGHGQGQGVVDQDVPLSTRSHSASSADRTHPLASLAWCTKMLTIVSDPRMRLD